MSIPDPHYKGHAEIIAYAKKIGTFGKDDRSPQYEGEGRNYSPEKLLKNQNLAFFMIRKDKRDRLWQSVLIVLFSAVLARSPEIYAFVFTLIR
jgi:hypothetical protein